MVEGNEEELFVRLLKRHCDPTKFLIDIQNAHGYGSIANRYIAAIAVAIYDFVFCVYDVDDGMTDPQSPFNQVRRSLRLFLGSEESVDNVSLCTNPNILQLILLCCRPLDEVRLLSTSKKTNTPFVHRCFPSIGRERNYDAADWQLRLIGDAFEYGTYHFPDILSNAADLSTDYRKLPDSNWLTLIPILLNGEIKAFAKRYSFLTNHQIE